MAATSSSPGRVTPWVREVSRFWTAEADSSCPAPRSDDYSDWTLTQLKREIVQRHLQTNPKKRNKSAFVQILLADDEVEASDDPPYEQPAAAQSMSRAASSQEVVDICDDDEEDVVAVASRPRATSQRQRPQKRPRTVEPPEKGADGDRSERSEYLHHKLSLHAARLDIDSRRLELEMQRERRGAEMHAVQLALAEEQLQQAKLATQKLKREWLVDQMLQKKRLRDAGISAEESASLGLF